MRDADNEIYEGIRITSMVLNRCLVRFCRQTTAKTIEEMQTYAWERRQAFHEAFGSGAVSFLPTCFSSGKRSMSIKTSMRLCNGSGSSLGLW